MIDQNILKDTQDILVYHLRLKLIFFFFLKNNFKKVQVLTL